MALLVVKARFGVQLLLPRTLAASASKVDEMAAAAMKATENAVAAELAAQTKAWEVREDLEQAQAIMAKLQAGQGQGREVETPSAAAQSVAEEVRVKARKSHGRMTWGGRVRTCAAPRAALCAHLPRPIL